MDLGKDIKNYILKFHQELLFLDVLDEILFKRKRDSYYVFNNLEMTYTYLYKPKENGFQAQNILPLSVNLINRTQNWNSMILR